MKQTTITKPRLIKKEWYLIDAKNLVLGRLATKIASILQGKNKANFQKNVDNGDYVIIINSQNIQLTGDKWNKKIYYSHSQYPGGLKKISAINSHKKNPCTLVYKAVYGMLPHNSLGARQLKNLFIYKNDKHNHSAQKPKLLNL